MRLRRFFLLMMALLLIIGTCLPAYADSGSTGSGTGSAGGGVTPPLQSGNMQLSYIGVTVQVVTFPYKDSYNKENSYQNIVNTIQNYTTANEGTTVYNGLATTGNTFMLDAHTGRVYKAPGFNKDTQTGTFIGSYHNGAISIHPVEQSCVTVEMNGGLSNANGAVTLPAMNKVEKFLQRIILGSSFGSWDIGDVALDSSGKSLAGKSTATSADDVSTFAQTLRYLGVSETLINNYVKGFSGQLSVTEHGNTPIPTIIWSYVMFECYASADIGRVPSPTGYTYYDSGSLANGTYFISSNRMFGYPYTCYTVGDVGVYSLGQAAFDNWWKSSYSSAANCLAGQSSCKWPVTDSVACRSAFGTHGGHSGYQQSPNYSSYMFGSGCINRINATGVDASAGNQFYFRGYWTPFGEMEKPKTAKFSITKSIDASAACIAQIKDNPMYSLAGAEYQVTANGAVTETLVTDANGKATSSKEYTIGSSVIVKEVKAPKGFKLNTTPYTFTIGASNSFSVKDEPLFDPPFAVTKVDKNTTNPQGNTSFSGAIFKWEYFANENWSGKATRTWYFRTDANGRAHYTQNHLAAGYTSDALYTDASGSYEIPLGTIKITEVKNSLGYIVIPKPLYCSIVADPSSPTGATYVWAAESLGIMIDMANGNFGVYEPIDETLFGSLTVDKVDAIIGTAQGGATLQGAKFQVINNSANSVKIGDFPEAAPGAVCYEFTTDANGHYETGRIFPLGSYTVKEATPPAGYTLNSSWSQNFTVTADQQDFSFTKGNNKACPNTPIMGGIKIVKQDSVLGQNTGSNALLAGITFSVISENAQPVVVNGTTYQKGATVLTMEVKWDGSQWTASSGDATLPYGSYTVKENPAPGSSFPNPYYQLNTTPQTVKIQENKKVSVLTFSNVLRPGSITINKATNTGANKGNWKFDLYNSSKTYVGTYTTADNGTVTISNLVPGVYYLTEQDRNDVYWVCDGEEKKVTVNPAEDTPVTFTNTHYGKLQIRKEMVTDGPVEGWRFQVTRLSDNADMGVLVSSADGTILSDKLLPGDYLVKEIFEENSLYYCKTENPVTVTITAGETATVSFTNALRPGKITIEKVNYEGEHLAGAKFLLEWSEDGKTWTPVIFSDKEDVVKGCSTAAGLEDGCLITDETGIITFSTLYPGLQYRVTELEAPEGYNKLIDYAFVGELPIEDLTVSEKAVNGRAYILPPTGMEGHKMVALGTCLAVLPVAGLSLLVIARRKKRRG